MKSINKTLKVSHYAQIPCKPFEIIIEAKKNLVDKLTEDCVERKAAEYVSILAFQHLFLLSEEIIPDYSNTIVVSMLDEKTGEWEDYFNEHENMNWDELEEKYFSDMQEKLHLTISDNA